MKKFRVTSLYRYWRRRINLDNELFRSIRKWDWRALSICFVTAFTFWIFHSLNEDHTTNIDIPLKVQYEQANIVALSTPPNHLTVNVTGNGWALLSKSLGFSLNTLNLDIENPVNINFVTGKMLLPEVNRLLKGLKVNYLMEDSVFFDYDELVDKSVPLKVDIASIPLGEGYEVVSDVFITPDTVNFTGPKSFISKLPPVWTIDLDEHEPIEESFDESVPITKANQKYTSVDYAEVNVSFEVAYIVKERVPAKLRLVDFPSNVEPVNETVYISYEIKEYDIMEDIDSLNVWLEYKDLNKADTTIKPMVTLDDRFRNVTVYPERVKLRIKNKKDE
ncbi:hypothetical protein V6R21_28795 [Limibacter armeniacum]|uniref:hypothetical protein n=1 Tax=Limibacter armeniacum TaxID=466084 RepID=UPI002FE5258C